ncbi:MAG TPA: hypothetical protein PL110_20800 [Candidatus Eremiobacteraeota bacterium]|nr:hypothetical protein [Candidatus Eremiobacteraeota bacterium]
MLKNLSYNFYIALSDIYYRDMPEYGDKILQENLKNNPGNFTLKMVQIKRLINLNKTLLAEKELLKLIDSYPLYYQSYLKLARLYKNCELIKESDRFYYKAYMHMHKERLYLLRQELGTRPLE